MKKNYTEYEGCNILVARKTSEEWKDWMCCSFSFVYKMNNMLQFAQVGRLVTSYQDFPKHHLMATFR